MARGVREPAPHRGRSRGRTCVLLLVSLGLGACASPPAPKPLPPQTRPPVPGIACDAPGVLAEIMAAADRLGGPRVLSWEDVVETGFIGQPNPASRWRWCLATAVLSDGRRVEARWLFAKPDGATIGRDLGWCIAGLSHRQCTHLAP